MKIPLGSHETRTGTVRISLAAGSLQELSATPIAEDGSHSDAVPSPSRKQKRRLPASTGLGTWSPSKSHLRMVMRVLERMSLELEEKKDGTHLVYSRTKVWKREKRSLAKLEEQSPMVNGNNRSEETDRIYVEWLNEMPDSKLESEAGFTIWRCLTTLARTL
jgi:hypothetical protein